MRAGLEQVVARLTAVGDEPFESRICVDTAPLLERSYARLAGLGWIGRNSCLINQEQGSWFLLGEVLLSLPLAPDAPPPDRCGTCRRCIDACPTDALVPNNAGGFRLDSRQCISYLTIEKRGALPEEMEGRTGNNVFGCDICQDVCPWNNKATVIEGVAPDSFALPLEWMANLNADQFRQRFRNAAVWRSKYAGFLRNVALAMGNSDKREFLEPLRRLTEHADFLVAQTAQRALVRLTQSLDDSCAE